MTPGGDSWSPRQKDAGNFPDELVEAVVEMLRDRWQPSPPPTWITCVPSRRNPQSRFGLRLIVWQPLWGCRSVQWWLRRGTTTRKRSSKTDTISATTSTASSRSKVLFRMEPVLLVDDIVDSGWTMTIIAALLRQAGSGPVWPLALASAKPGE